MSELSMSEKALDLCEAECATIKLELEILLAEPPPETEAEQKKRNQCVIEIMKRMQSAGQRLHDTLRAVRATDWQGLKELAWEKSSYATHLLGR